MNQVPALSTLCTDYIVNNGQNFFSPLCSNTILQKIYLRQRMVDFFGGTPFGKDDRDFIPVENQDSVPNQMMIKELTKLLGQHKPIPFPYPELKDKTLYIHALGEFGYLEDLNDPDGDVVNCCYLALGTQERMLYALVSDQRRTAQSCGLDLGCNYNVFSLSDYKSPELFAQNTTLNVSHAGPLACLIINGFPCHANIHWHDCALTFS